MRDQLNISLVQLDITWEDTVLNLHRIEELLNSNSFEADLIILPEMFNTGFTMHPQRVASDETNLRVIDWMKSLAIKKHATIAGSMAYYEHGRYFNRLMAVTQEGAVTHYDKRHLFRMAGEHKVYDRGEKRVVLEVGKWRVALFVCYDLRFPVWSRNLNQYDLAIYVANWPHKRLTAWTTLLNARAIENQCYVAAVNRVGKDPAESYSGHTALIDYMGKVVKKAADNIETVVNETLYLSDLEKFRAVFPAWMDADNLDVTIE